MEINFESYHEAVKASALSGYPNFGDSLVYPALGAAAEAGELADKVKHLWRDHGITHAKQFEDEVVPEAAITLRNDAIKEAGDVLWYLDAFVSTLGLTLAEVAQINIEKIHGRAARGTSLGTGDHR